MFVSYALNITVSHSKTSLNTFVPTFVEYDTTGGGVNLSEEFAKGYMIFF